MKRQLLALLALAGAFCCVMMSVGPVPAMAQNGTLGSAVQVHPQLWALFLGISDGDTLEPVVEEPLPEPELQGGQDPPRGVTRVQFGYHTFTTASMSEAYDPVSVLTLENVWWGKRFGFGFELGFTGGQGTPPQTDSNWNVGNSWVKISAVSIGLNALYRFMNTSNEGFLEPYASLGPAIWVGGERISAEATRSPVGVDEGFKAELLAVGVAYGANAALGTTLRVAGGVRALFEVGWTVTSGGTEDLSEEEEIENFESSLYSAVSRPGFDFTGWRFDIGLQW